MNRPRKDRGASADADRAVVNGAEGVSALRASVPSASDDENIEHHLARIIALYGLGTVNGACRFDPPTEEWNFGEWQARILEVIPVAAELHCRELAHDIVRAILGRSNAREIDDGIRTAPRFAAEQVRKFNPGMHGLVLNLNRLSDVLDSFAVSEVVTAQGIEAGTGETREAGLDAKHESPVAESDAPKDSGHD